MALTKSLKTLSILQMICLFAFPLLISVFHFPHGILYVMDIISIFCLILLIGNHNKLRLKDSPFIISVTIFFVISFLSGVFSTIKGNNPFFLFYSIRNTFRFYVLFLSVVYSFSENDVPKLLRWLKYVFVLNFLLCLVEFFVFHRSGDYLGGIFGIEQGCNGQLNMFLDICISIAFVLASKKKISYFKMQLIFFSSLFMAMMAEIKFLFVESAILFFVSIFFNKGSRNKFRYAIPILLAYIIGIIALAKFMPGSFDSLFNASNRANYLSASYAGGRLMGRTTAIDMINRLFFGNRFFTMLVGNGFGSAETSGFIQTAFYSKYGSMEYRYFSFAFIYLQQGWIGLILYVVTFISLLLMAKKAEKKNRRHSISFDVLILIVISSFFCFYYNDSMLTEIAYLDYFVLGIVCIKYKDLFFALPRKKISTGCISSHSNLSLSKSQSC